MKEQIEQLIDRLASKELTFGCEVAMPAFHGGRGILFEAKRGVNSGGDIIYVREDMKILGHPILIGDVLEKIGFNWAKKAVDEHLHNTVWILEKAQNDLLKLWNPCGFTKSLQELAEREWHAEDPCKHPGKEHERACFRESEGRIVLVPKQKPIRELFQFLLQLGL